MIWSPFYCIRVYYKNTICNNSILTNIATNHTLLTKRYY